MLRIDPFVSASVDKELWHYLLVQVVVNRRARWRSKCIEQERNLVVLDQEAGLLDRAGRTVAVIKRDEIDLAPGSAALIVQLLKERCIGLTDRTEMQRPVRYTAWCCRS